jgi:hypothetical protein
LFLFFKELEVHQIVYLRSPKFSHVETINFPLKTAFAMGGGEIKENNGGDEFNYDIL